MSTDVLVALIGLGVAVVGGIGSVIGILLNNNTKVNKRFDEIDDRFGKLDEASKIKEAYEMRRRILLFYNDERSGRIHSREYWDDVLNDCTNYKKVVKWFEDNEIPFSNNKGTRAMQYLEETFDIKDKADDFLK